MALYCTDIHTKPDVGAVLLSPLENSKNIGFTSPKCVALGCIMIFGYCYFNYKVI